MAKDVCYSNDGLSTVQFFSNRVEAPLRLCGFLLLG